MRAGSNDQSTLPTHPHCPLCWVWWNKKLGLSNFYCSTAVHFQHFTRHCSSSATHWRHWKILTACTGNSYALLLHPFIINIKQLFTMQCCTNHCSALLQHNFSNLLFYFQASTCLERLYLVTDPLSPPPSPAQNKKLDTKFLWVLTGKHRVI